MKSTSPILSSSFQLERGTLWFGTIELYENKIVVSGWTWTGPVETQVSIDDIRHVEKWTVQEGPNFRIVENGNGNIYGRIETGAKFWADAFKEDDRVRLKLRH